MLRECPARIGDVLATVTVKMFKKLVDAQGRLSAAAGAGGTCRTSALPFCTRIPQKTSVQQAAVIASWLSSIPASRRRAHSFGITSAIRSL